MYGQFPFGGTTYGGRIESGQSSATTTQTLTGKARVTARTTRTLTGVGRIGSGSSSSIYGIARIKRTATYTITGQGRISKGQNIYGKASISGHVQRTIYGKAFIITSQTRKLIIPIQYGYARHN
jgi:hypothetical protein